MYQHLFVWVSLLHGAWSIVLISKNKGAKMKHEFDVEVLRGAVVVLTSFFVTALVVGSIGRYFFLIWLIPLIIMVFYPLFIKYDIIDIINRDEDNITSEDIKSKRNITKSRILMIILVIILWSVLTRYVSQIRVIYSLFGIIIIFIFGEYVISHYVKR